MLTPRIAHRWTDDRATVRVEGLAAPVRMLHLTDTCLMACDDRDGVPVEACRYFCARFAANERDEAGRGYAPDEWCRYAMSDAASADLDLLALTGDIVHYPSAAAVEFVADRVARLGVRAYRNGGTEPGGRVLRARALRTRRWRYHASRAVRRPARQQRRTAAGRVPAVMMSRCI
jgi:hypothetical protein